jgi:hypothetical protein
MDKETSIQPVYFDQLFWEEWEDHHREYPDSEEIESRRQLKEYEDEKRMMDWGRI